MGHCEPDGAPLQMHSLLKGCLNNCLLRPNAANSRDEAKLCIIKAASSLLHY